MKPNPSYIQLEFIAKAVQAASPTPRPQTVAQAWGQAQPHLRRLGRFLLAYFSGSTEPRIAVRCDRQGHRQFVVYDPVDQQRHCFDSEPELRTWLDQRYYQ
jgi:hypothetical protein